MQELTPRQILDQLVSFPTVSRSSNLDLIDWLEAYLAGHGITEARLKLWEGQTFARVEVTDRAGKRAWSNPIFLADISA